MEGWNQIMDTLNAKLKNMGCYRQLSPEDFWQKAFDQLVLCTLGQHFDRSMYNGLEKDRKGRVMSCSYNMRKRREVGLDEGRERRRWW